jgi:putative ABC transport system permease protein
MTALHHKLVRELWSMKGQALAIAMVIGSGVATFIMSLTTLHSLQVTQAAFYQESRFADVFAGLKRAPESVARQLAEIEGVRYVQTEVVAAVNLDIEGYPDPASAQLISYDAERTVLNRLYLRSGRLADPLQGDEVVVSEAFAEAQQLGPGDSLTAIINGSKKKLTIVGVALSPEYILQIRPGSLVPDFESYAILWMAREQLATAYDMDGAFNAVAMALNGKAKAGDVIDRVDRVLARYGGLGAYARKDQFSHRYLSEEFRQLQAMATVFPVVFLAVAAFLLNIFFRRLIQTQREEIATLKAFGYSNWAIGVHYSQLVAAIAAGGLAVGAMVGLWLGRGLSNMYVEVYRFPYLQYELDPQIFLQAVGITLGAAFTGTLYALRRAALQPPAEAMRPEPPARYRRTWLERKGFGKLLSEPGRIIWRSLRRRPGKAISTSIGIASAYAILMTGLFFQDSLDYMMDVQFHLTERDDITVSFVEPTSRRAVFDLLRIPGVQQAETFRAVPVRMRFQQRTYRTLIHGVEPDGWLYRVLDSRLRRVRMPEEGLLLTDYLAELLGARPGDEITVEILEGARPVRQIPLAGTSSQFLGVSGTMHVNALNRLMLEGNAISGAYLLIDRAQENQVYAELKEMPRVAGAEVKRKAVESLNETMGEQILIFAAIATLLAATIAFGVVYNSARIALSERARELASLRVLGYTRGEASFILLGELAVLTVAALPLGMLLGRLLCGLFILTWQTDLFRLPLVLEPRTYSYAALVVLVCSVVSGLIVRHRIDHLDLVGVLKTRA